MSLHERESLKETKEDADKQLYKGAFDDFDWNKNGTIPTRVIMNKIFNQCFIS